MEPSRSKRRTLISFSSYVSPQGPDVPARFESLNDDTLTTTLQFVGDKSYRSFGGLNKHCREIYLATEGMKKETFIYGYAPLSRITDKIERAILDYNYIEVCERVGKGVVLYNRRDVLKWGLEERNNKVLRGICHAAAGEDRLDVLIEVWNNIDDEDKTEDIFEGVDSNAVRYGRLNVLKWFKTNELYINKNRCAREAAEYGKLDILKWLEEEKGLELKRELYENAALGGQLNVMKWLKEQEVPWTDYTFERAAHGGNLDVLQWLHDEGCPWNSNRVHERRLKPEVVEWLRSNGYGHRIW